MALHAKPKPKGYTKSLKNLRRSCRGEGEEEENKVKYLNMHMVLGVTAQQNKLQYRQKTSNGTIAAPESAVYGVL